MRKRSNPDSEQNIKRIDTKQRAKKQTHGFQVHFVRGSRLARECSVTPFTEAKSRLQGGPQVSPRGDGRSPPRTTLARAASAKARKAAAKKTARKESKPTKRKR
jgi:hypothetical protein